MILLASGTNKVDLTLTEKTTISPVYYVFVFINVITGLKIACYAPDTSSFKDRYNRFSLTQVASSPDPLNGELVLVNGFYDYYVFEYTLAQKNNFIFANVDNIADVTQLGNIVEQGKMLYEFSTPVYNNYVNDKTSIKEYAG